MNWRDADRYKVAEGPAVRCCGFCRHACSGWTQCRLPAHLREDGAKPWIHARCTCDKFEAVS